MEEYYYNSTNAFINILKHLLAKEDDVNVRGTITKESLGRTIKLVDSTQRVYMLPHRNDNIFAKIAETLWMLAGRNDIDWLSYYLPRAPTWADDGKHWRGGYGPRLRNWPVDGITALDQIAYVMRAFEKDIYTRQAIISIWNPEIDTQPGKDIPCNNWIQFIVRDSMFEGGRKVLNMHVTQRSCDAMWGYSGVDTFSWSVLHEMMAYWLDASVGQFSHFIGSLHVYDKHWDRAKKIVDGYRADMYNYGINSVPIKVDYLRWDGWLHDILNMEFRWRDSPNQAYWDDIHETYEDDFLTECAKMLFIYVCHKTRQPLEQIVKYVSELRRDTDFRMAAIEYLSRQYGTPYFYEIASATEMEAFQAMGFVK